mmetsp:Transcript_28823/g.81200  ORF Transcript_28823/g.81200 Transcript_28823/m.81200 type:complete len:269 (-) Transcript_28823:24-830(-)
MNAPKARPERAGTPRDEMNVTKATTHALKSFQPNFPSPSRSTERTTALPMLLQFMATMPEAVITWMRMKSTITVTANTTVMDLMRMAAMRPTMRYMMNTLRAVFMPATHPLGCASLTPSSAAVVIVGACPVSSRLSRRLLPPVSCCSCSPALNLKKFLRAGLMLRLSIVFGNRRSWAATEVLGYRLGRLRQLGLPGKVARTQQRNGAVPGPGGLSLARAPFCPRGWWRKVSTAGGGGALRPPAQALLLSPVTNQMQSFRPPACIRIRE